MGCCKVKSLTLPASLVDRSSLNLGNWLLLSQKVALQKRVPDSWFEQRTDNPTLQSLNQLLNDIGREKPPLKRSDRAAFLARLPLKPFLEVNDHRQLIKLQKLLAHYDGYLLERAAELTLACQLPVLRKMTDRILQQCESGSLPKGLAGRFLCYAGKNEQGFELLCRADSQDSFAARSLIPLMMDKAENAGTALEAAAWRSVVVRRTEYFYRRGDSWTKSCINELVEQHNCPDAGLLQWSRTLSGKSGFDDIDRALVALTEIYRALDNEIQADPDSWGNNSQTVAVQRVLNVLQSRLDNVGKVFVHARNPEALHEYQGLRKRIETVDEVTGAEYYKAGVCYLFGLEGFSANEHTALHCLNMVAQDEYPQVWLLLRLLGEPSECPQEQRREQPVIPPPSTDDGVRRRHGGRGHDKKNKCGVS